MDKLPIKSFTQLDAWQVGHRLVLDIYQATRHFPQEEQYGLTAQLRRAAVSITSNVAEGFSRQGYKEKIQFYSMALGSLTEAQNQLLIARDVGYLEGGQFAELAQQAIVVSKLINGLIKSSKQFSPDSRFMIHDSSKSGFTLLELIIASGIFAAASLAGFVVLSNAHGIQVKTAALRNVSETARFTLEAIAREVRLANGGLVVAADGTISQVQPAFLILSQTGQAAPVGADGRVLGERLLITSTDLARRVQTVRLISFDDQLTIKTCADVSCRTITQEAELAPDDLSIESVSFRGLPDGLGGDRQPFLEIGLIVATAANSGRAVDQAHLTLKTIVTTRHFTGVGKL